jgi:hypothetical protein
LYVKTLSDEAQGEDTQMDTQLANQQHFVQQAAAKAAAEQEK